MNEYTQQIKGNLDDFQCAVQKLSVGIRDASILWRDAKYAELSAEMAQVANESRAVLMAGDKCCASIDRFFKISEEEY